MKTTQIDPPHQPTLPLLTLHATAAQPRPEYLTSTLLIRVSHRLDSVLLPVLPARSPSFSQRPHPHPLLLGWDLILFVVEFWDSRGDNGHPEMGRSLVVLQSDALTGFRGWTGVYGFSRSLAFLKNCFQVIILGLVHTYVAVFTKVAFPMWFGLSSQTDTVI